MLFSVLLLVVVLLEESSIFVVLSTVVSFGLVVLSVVVSFGLVVFVVVSFVLLDVLLGIQSLRSELKVVSEGQAIHVPFVNKLKFSAHYWHIVSVWQTKQF